MTDTPEQHLDTIIAEENERRRQAQLAEYGFVTRDGLPHVAQNRVNLTDLVNGTLVLLHDHNLTDDPGAIYSGPEGLTRIVTTASGETIMRPMSSAAIRLAITEVVQTVNVSEDGTRTPADPKGALVDSIRDHHDAGFPPLIGIGRSPTILDDGTIVAESGYSPLTRTFLDLPNDLALPAVKAKPTKADVRRAVQLFRDDLFVDFMWSDKSSLTNAVSLICTVVLREMFTGCSPLFAIVANQQGAGKSLISKLAGIVGTGRAVPSHPHPTNAEEARKLITSVLRTSPSLVVFDNAASMVKAPELARLLTSTTWADRVLGHSRSVSLPNRATWTVNGNALRFGGDIGRRVVPIDIEADRPDPWNRSGFKHRHLELWTIEHRGEILAAIFTMARAWLAADRPEPKRTHGGGFESWSIVVGGIVEHAGFDGFLANLDRVHDDDHEADAWAILIRYLIDDEHLDTFTASQLLDRCEGGVHLGEHVAEVVHGSVTSKSLGEALATRDGRWHDLGGGRAGRVCRGDLGRAGSRLWHIEHRKAAT